MNQTWPILYANAKTGKIKIWSIKVKENEIITTHGLEGCKMKTSRKIVHKGKNIGKKNETTPEQQAFAMAESKWIAKLKREGYVKSKAQLKTQKTYFPMLAAKYNPDKDYFNHLLCQPKLNGIRLISVKQEDRVTLYTRKGKDVTLIHWDLAQQLCRMMSNGWIFDGEIYVHGWSFERITRAFKKERYDTYGLEYHVYDFITDPKTNGYGRWIELNMLRFCTTTRIKRVTTTSIINTDSKVLKQELEQFRQDMVRNGYEGAIYRDPNAAYLWGHRGKRLLKHKEMLDAEFRIIGYTCGTGNDEGAIIFKCRTRKLNGSGYHYFNCRPDGEIKKRRDMYKKGWTYVGKMLTVSFQAWSDKHVPIFPVGISVRDYE